MCFKKLSDHYPLFHVLIKAIENFGFDGIDVICS